MHKKISIVLAIHNEYENLPNVIKSIDTSKQHIDKNYSFEIIAINDGSTDNSSYMLHCLRKEYPDLNILTHNTKKGMTKVVTSAMGIASGDIIMFFPADMESHPDEDIPKLLTVLEDGFDVAAGMRVGRSDGKCITSMIGNYIVARVFKLKLHDINWIKAMTREAAKTMVLKHAWVRYMLLFPHFKGMRIKEVETKWYHRTYGRSKFGPMRLFEALKDLLLLFIFYHKTIKPQKNKTTLKRIIV